MQTTYKLRGMRFIRPYTAPVRTPTTAAGSDAIAIGENLCRVDWVRAAPSSASFPVYSKPDENAAARDNFDSAEWCAEHDTKAMTHRAYAQAAIYRFRLPDVEDVTIGRVSVSVTCDPYTPQGARVAAMCTDSDDLPTVCAEVRSMQVFASGVAPRVSSTSENGEIYWYESTATVELDLDGSWGKWLLVFVGLEEWRARNGWLEGAAKINAVTAQFSDAIDGWDVDEPADCRSGGNAPYPICRGGVLPDMTGDDSPIVRTVVQLNGDSLPDSVTEKDGELELARRGDIHADIQIADSAIGLRLAFANLFSGAMSTVKRDGASRPGARFVVRRRQVDRTTDLAEAPVQVSVWEIECSSLAIPFACPTTFGARRVKIDWTGWGGAPSSGLVFHVWLRRESASTDPVVASKPEFYDWRGGDVDGWEHVGLIDPTSDDDQTATFELVRELGCRVATIMITAFQPMDAVDPATPGDVWGCEAEFKPDLTLLD